MFTSAEQLYQHDMTFQGAIDVWVRKKWCDERLKDYLAERELLSQADCAEWATSCPQRPIHRMKDEGRKSRAYPQRSDEWYYWVTDNHIGKDDADVESCYIIPFVNIKEDISFTNNKFDTPEGAILWLLDAWEIVDYGIPQMTHCHKCHEVRLCEFTYDPFLAEYHGEYTEKKWWCMDCHKLQCDEI